VNATQIAKTGISGQVCRHIYILAKLNYKDSDNLNRPIMNNYIELVIKSSSKEKPRTGWLH
jgi:hypothetical protein